MLFSAAKQVITLSDDSSAARRAGLSSTLRSLVNRCAARLNFLSCIMIPDCPVV